MEEQEEQEKPPAKHVFGKMFFGIVVGGIFTALAEGGYDWLLNRKKNQESDPEEE